MKVRTGLASRKRPRASCARHSHRVASGSRALVSADRRLSPASARSRSAGRDRLPSRHAHVHLRRVGLRRRRGTQGGRTAFRESHVTERGAARHVDVPIGRECPSGHPIRLPHAGQDTSLHHRRSRDPLAGHWRHGGDLEPRSRRQHRLAALPGTRATGPTVGKRAAGDCRTPWGVLSGFCRLATAGIVVRGNGAGRYSEHDAGTRSGRAHLRGSAKRVVFCNPRCAASAGPHVRRARGRRGRDARRRPQQRLLAATAGRQSRCDWHVRGAGRNAVRRDRRDGTAVSGRHGHRAAVDPVYTGSGSGDPDESRQQGVRGHRRG